MPQSVVRGTVRSRADGSAVRGAVVALRPRPCAGRDGAVRAITGDDGAFEIDGLSPGELALALWRGPETAPADMRLGPFAVGIGETKDLALEIGDGGALQGVFRLGSAPPGAPMAHASASGTTRIEHLAPGTYRVLAHRGAARSETAKLTIIEGETTVVGLTLAVE